MDNGYPNYYIDETQGGEEAWKQAIADYRADGNRLVLYYNGRLVDRESDWYMHGNGKSAVNRDNTGAEFAEHYKFTGEGTALPFSSRLWEGQGGRARRAPVAGPHWPPGPHLKPRLPLRLSRPNQRPTCPG